MSQGTRYVEIPAESLLAELRAISKAVEAKGGHATQGKQGREIIFDFTPPTNRGSVRVFTTLAAGADVARACGEDAVRIIVGIVQGAEGKSRFRNLTAPRKMLRTAPQGLEEHERVRTFLDRLTQALREAYKVAATVPLCPDCNGLMAIRSAKSSGREFYGCLNFPGCRGTRPKAA